MEKATPHPMHPIAVLLAALREDEGLPVIFNGTGPRYIGRALSLGHADIIALENKLSATFISKARVRIDDGSEKECFLLHG